MRVALLIAWREYIENVRTKGFWIGVLLVPIVFFLIFHFSTRLASASPTRYYVLIDQSGQYGEVVETAIRREHQRRIMQAFMRHVQEYRRDSAVTPVPQAATSWLDQIL